MDTRLGRVQWGPSGERKRTSEDYWKQPYAWNAAAKAAGERHRVFCASLADIMDDHESIQPEWRVGLWKIVADTQNLEWLILSKRPHNFPVFLPVAECRPPFENVRLGVSLGSQGDVHYDMVGPLQCAHYFGFRTFVSYEPALGPIDWRDLLERGYVDWLIAGGESGPKARPPHPNWFRAARDACAECKVPFLFKQWGEWSPHDPVAGGDLGADVRAGRVQIVQPGGEDLVKVAEMTGGRSTLPGARYMARVGKKRAGRLLDGREHNEFPRAA